MARTPYNRRSIIVVAIAMGLLVATIPFVLLSRVIAAPNADITQRATAMAQRYATERAALPAFKQADADIRATNLAVGVLTPPVPRSLRPTLPPAPTPIKLVGIVDSRDNPFRRTQPAQNTWFGDYNGENIAVFAGYLYNDLSQGLVGVATGLDGDITHATYTEYLTPIKVGPVRITAVNGTRLTLAAQDGTRFVFDYATRTFV